MANGGGDGRDQGLRRRGRGDGDLSPDREDALYGLPLDQFIAERDELAKRLRKDGDREGAARVKSLRKPSVAAWAVNQLARSQPKTIRELADAGEALRDAQEAIVAGKGDADELRSAGERERAAVQELLQAARGLLSGSGAGLSESTLEDVADTLRAAAVDDDTRELVLAGRLDRERRAAGLGAGLGAFAVSSGAARAGAARAEPAAAPEKGKGATAKPKGTTAKGRGETAKGRGVTAKGKGATAKGMGATAKPRTGKAAEAERAKRAAEKEAARRAEAAREEERRAARVAAKEAASAARRAEREHELAESRLRNAQDALEKAKETHAAAKTAEREARRARDQAAKEARRLRVALD